MKKALYIVGMGLIIGFSAISVYLLNTNKKVKFQPEEQKEEQFSKSEMSLKNDTKIQEEPVYENIKSSVAESVYDRHQDAAVEMRNSVEKIRKNLNGFTETNNEIDEVSAELDKMLSED